MSVTVRELKAQLSEYLRCVREGMTVNVTSHGRLVARLVRAEAPAESVDEMLRKQAWFRVARASGRVGLEPMEVLSGGGSMSATVTA